MDKQEFDRPDAADTVNVDTLERGALRALPEDSAEYSVLMARQCVSDLAARAREWERRCKLEYEVRMDTRKMLEAAEADRDRLREVLNKQNALLHDTARRVAEMEQSVKTIVKEDGVVVSRQARRVAELEAALREVERYFGSELPPAGFPLGAVRAALTGDGGGAAYCTCPEGADGNPCGVCGKPEAVAARDGVGGEFHAEGLDERGIYGGLSYPAGDGGGA